ncbi:MAG: hypothetical protein HYT72_05145 [Candidatus Aenigmarchaeota archaeon]|nr:hypothetical protein [Candidatus Aenigmarchaeota archaeon]
MHQYELIDKESNRRLCVVLSTNTIESATYPQVIKDAALAIEYLRLIDGEIASKYELKYLGEFREPKAGWG